MDPSTDGDCRPRVRCSRHGSGPTGRLGSARLARVPGNDELRQRLRSSVGSRRGGRRAGKVRYIGASSMYAWQFARAQHVAETHGWTKFVSMQNHLNLVYREEEREMLPLCREDGIGVIPWSPLARGLLAGNRGRGDDK